MVKKIRRLGIIMLVLGLCLEFSRYNLAAEKGLVGYWKFNEGKGEIAKDSSGKGNDGKVYGAKWVKGTSGFALQFNGAKNYVETSEIPIGNNMTWECWISASEARNEFILDHRSGNKGVQPFYLRSNGAIQFYDSTKGACETSAGVFKFGSKWHHLAATITPTKMYLYYDGEEKKNKTVSPISWSARDMHIGCRHSKSGYFKGLIDEVAIFDVALSAEEIRKRYNQSGLRISDVPTDENLISNPGFEGDWKVIKGNDVPEGYRVDDTPIIKKSTANPHTGKYCIRIEDDDEKASEGLFYSFDPKPYRGKTGYASVWVRADKPGKASIMVTDRPDHHFTKVIETTSFWQKIEVSFNIAKDAIRFQVYLWPFDYRQGRKATGIAYFDDLLVSFEQKVVAKVTSKETTRTKKGLIAYYPMEEGTGSLINDMGISGARGFITMATWTEGKLGKSLYFNGKDSYVQIEENKILDNITDEITVEAWVKGLIGTDIGNGPNIVARHDVYFIGFSTSGYLRSGIYSYSRGRHWNIDNTTDKKMRERKWTYVAFTYDRKNLKQYVDGERVGDMPLTKPIRKSHHPILIGTYAKDWQTFRGAIDEVRIYNKALSEEEIKTSFQKQASLPMIAERTEKERILYQDKFKNIPSWKVIRHQDGEKITDSKDLSLIKRTEKVAYKKEPALKLHYDFPTEGEDAILLSKDTIITRGNLLEITVFGDNSGNKLSLILKDKSGEKHFLPLGRIDFSGWKTLDIDFSSLFLSPEEPLRECTHYGGDNNQKLDYPIEEVTLCISDYPDTRNSKGDIWLANLKIKELKPPFNAGFEATSSGNNLQCWRFFSGEIKAEKKGANPLSYTGEKSAHLKSDKEDFYGGYSQTLSSLQSNTLYKLSGYIKLKEFKGKVEPMVCEIRDDKGRSYRHSGRLITKEKGGWALYQNSFLTPDISNIKESKVIIYPVILSGKGEVYLDEVSLKPEELPLKKDIKLTSGKVKTSPLWEPKKICEKEFYFEMPYSRMELFKKAGIDKEPFIKEGVLLLSEEETRDKKIYKEILELSNPIFLKGGFIHKTVPLIKFEYPFYKKLEEDFKDRFLGINKFGEWIPHTFNRAPSFVGETKIPSDRYEAYDFYRKVYQKEILGDKRYKIHNQACATFTQHFEYSLGSVIASPELTVGYDPVKKVAFARGAGRQYKRPWGTYIACYSGPPTTYNFLCPERVKTMHIYKTGPHTGSSLSQQKRVLYLAYIAGANIIRHEQDAFSDSIYVANYDFKDIEDTDFSVRSLRDKPYCLSPMGAVYKELYDNIVKKHDRGTPYTPVGLVFDRYHGCVTGYDVDHILNMKHLPYQKGDHMMRGVLHTLFPTDPVLEEYQKRKKFGWEATMSSGPFGDIFDVLTNDAGQDILQSYPVLLITGRVDMDKGFAKKLINYVEKGGTLIINTKQLTPEFSPSFLGVKLTGEEIRGSSFSSYIDGIMMIEDTEFTFEKIEPTTATPIAVSLDSGKPLPLLTLNKYGKGRVILSTPFYLQAPGLPHYRMLKLFSYLMEKIKEELVPFSWTGWIECLINRNKTGWVITLINNEGVIKGKKPCVKKETIQPEKTQKVTLNFKSDKVKEINEWTEEKSLTGIRGYGETKVKITIPPGEIRIIEFVL